MHPIVTSLKFTALLVLALLIALTSAARAENTDDTDDTDEPTITVEITINIAPPGDNASAPEPEAATQSDDDESAPTAETEE